MTRGLKRLDKRDSGLIRVMCGVAGLAGLGLGIYTDGGTGAQNHSATDSMPALVSVA